MNVLEPFYIQKDNIYTVPIVHYHMEMAAQVKLAYDAIKPDCVAVELPETLREQFARAAGRLPDLSVVVAYGKSGHPIYYMCEPCEATLEGLRCGMEGNCDLFCIDLDVNDYPEMRDLVPDPYSVKRIGLAEYYHLFQKVAAAHGFRRSDLDIQREIYMAKRLKELSLSYDKVLFIGGMFHVHSILQIVDNTYFPKHEHAVRVGSELCALSEESYREVMAEFGWISKNYEEARENFGKRVNDFPPDRQKLLFNLLKEASENYKQKTGNAFPGYHFRNIMKFVRNYALITNRLMPDLYQLLSAAKGCVDHNYAYEVWELATRYPYYHNIDGLPELNLTLKDVWGEGKTIHFHLREKGKKGSFFQRHQRDKSKVKFMPPGPFSICSYPPEDVTIENFGTFLKKKGTQILTEEGVRTIPFTSSIEDGIDTRETIRHWHEKKLYIKVRGKPPGGVGSIVVIFDEDMPIEGKDYMEKYPWCTTWLGEHTQESDMALYATPMTANVVGPGISRCEYGGFMMSYPPRRMWNVWHDPDYQYARSKSETLLMAAIDYAVKPIVVYVAAKPPRSKIKAYAQHFGKKVVYIPIGQLSPVTLNKIRVFHVLDGNDKRAIADEYIY